MKRHIFTIILLLTIPFAIFADIKEDSTIDLPDAKSSYIESDGPSWLDYVNLDLYQETMLIRGMNVSVGGGVLLEYSDKNIGAGVYTNLYWLSKPAFARYEFVNEVGAHFEWNIANTGKGLSTRLVFDVGYYMQFIQPKTVYGDKFHLQHNGLVIAPGIDTSFKVTESYDIGIGIFYKKSIYPTFDGIDGLSLRITVL